MDAIERLKTVSGEDFNSRECRVTNPRITARESIEIADYIVQIERQNQELAAQVEVLSKLHSDLTNADMVFEDDVHSGYLITTEQIDEMEHLLATPTACLAQVRAEAVSEFAEFLFVKKGLNVKDIAKAEANRIRQEVK